MEQVLLSIIIPIFNVERYINKCVDSIVSQDLKHCEVLLIDDGSTDRCPLICEEYSKQFPNVHFFRKENGGLSDARNYGISKASGKYLMFVDGDDYLDQESVKRFLRIILDSNPDIIVGQSYAVFEDGTIKDELAYSIVEKEYTLNDYLLTLRKNSKSVIFCAQYYICRADIVANNSLSFEKGLLHEDEMWTPILLLHSKKIFYCNYRFYYHLMRPFSIMHSDNLIRRGESLITIANTLIPIYKEYEKQGYQLKYLKDRVASFYLQAFSFLGINSLHLFNRRLPMKNSCLIKTKLKSFLFFVSPRLYYNIWKKRQTK